MSDKRWLASEIKKRQMMTAEGAIVYAEDLLALLERGERCE